MTYIASDPWSNFPPSGEALPDLRAIGPSMASVITAKQNKANPRAYEPSIITRKVNGAITKRDRDNPFAQVRHTTIKST